MTAPKYSRVALYLQDKHSIREGMEYVRYAEEKGFESVWQAESRLARDAIVPMAAFAAVTERIRIGSGVINNWTRNIGLLAATFLTLDDLAPDELVTRITASGTPEDVKKKVREYMDNGATCPILYPLGDVKLMIDTFADGF